jgi:hypothetical protein
MSRKRKRAARSAPLTKAIRKHLDVAREHVFWATVSWIAACMRPRPSWYRGTPGPTFEHAIEGAYALLQKAGGNLLDVLDDDMPADGGSS